MHRDSTEKYGIIGAGIIGLGIARQLLLDNPSATVIILEKESQIAVHQTGHNSGVIHAGLYYKPGSLKAKLCREGSEALIQYAEANKIPFDLCGKLVVATTKKEVAQLDKIFETATQNEVPGIQYLNPEEIHQLEPHISGLAAVHSPRTGIIDYPAVCRTILSEIEKLGGEIIFNTQVLRIHEDDDTALVETNDKNWSFDKVIVAAGLQSDRVSKASSQPSYPKIIPFSGDYYALASNKSSLINGLIYPVPDPKFPFLGVHLTKNIDGGVTVGPNASLAFKRESYKQFQFSLKDTFDTFTSLGFWKFLFKNKLFILQQLFTNSKSTFAKGASKFLPSINKEDLSTGTRGVRAQAVDRYGDLLDDFSIKQTQNVLYLRNAPSPAATASLAISQYIVKNYLD